jgi:hypothetical protein
VYHRKIERILVKYISFKIKYLKFKLPLACTIYSFSSDFYCRRPAGTGINLWGKYYLKLFELHYTYHVP